MPRRPRTAETGLWPVGGVELHGDGDSRFELDPGDAALEVDDADVASAREVIATGGS